MNSVNRGIAWKHFAINTKDKHGNSTGVCKYCSLQFIGSHGGFAAHFNPDDHSVRTCVQCPERVLTEMSSYHTEQASKREVTPRP